ncbi:sensor domain-containing protein [Deinococcus ruber]|uniref:Diguanylate cyclase n=1 Tax=Deinococcus ruber TaxID=1848197 RepID=A0A918CHE8_9DEIO|nr:EAL domain-containing protein [Deinococcus ruber]GGR22382.1 hypothetical protein GCM10008957_38080 [Deinococcus ruber]
MDFRLPGTEPLFDMAQLFEAPSLRLCLIEPESARLLAVSPDLRQLIPENLGESFDGWCDPDDRYWLDRWLQGAVPESMPYLTVAAVQEGQLAGGQWHLLRQPSGVVGVLSLPSDGPGFSPMVTALLDHLPTDLAVLDAHGRYLYTNRAAIRDDSVRQGIIGMTDRQYVEWRGHPLRLAELREEQFRRAIATRQPQQWEEVLETPQGLRTFRRSYIPVWSAQGELQLMLGYGTDITQSVAQARQVGLLERVVLTSRDPTMLLDASPGEHYRQLVYANLAFERLGLCSTLQSLIGTRLSEWGFGRRDESLLGSLLDRLELEGSLEIEVLLPDRQQWVEFSAQAIHNDQGNLTHWAVHLRNVTARKRTEQLRHSRLQAGTFSVEGRSIPEVLAPLLAGIQQWAPGWTAAVVFGLDGVARVAGDVSRAFRRWLTRVTSAEFRAIWAERDPQHLGRPHHHRDLWHEPQLAVHHQKLRRAGIRSTVEVPLYDHASQLLGVLFLSYPAISEPPALVADVLIDEASAVTLYLERDRQRHQLELLAYSDPLTGLLNRFAFLKHVETQLASRPADAPRPALALLDLDRFKQVNDGLGHAVGDVLLTQVAQRLRRLSSSVALDGLARLGGDEFAFLLQDEAQIDAATTATEVLFAPPFLLAGRAVHTGLSLGWSVVSPSASEVGTLLRQADAAMYIAKRSQAMAHRYSPAAQPRHRALALEQALHEGLEQQQFHLVYQPQVRVQDGTVCGAEALLRWEHPVLGVVAPDEFIVVAEATGLIVRLGNWVLRRACQDARRWKHPTLRLSVNISAVQLAQVSFPEMVRTALQQSGWPAERLVLEITETGFLTDLALTQTSLQSLRAQGVRVSLDDFGTGYSSLAQVLELPLDEVKIDRRFMQALDDSLPGSAGARAIVQSTVALSSVLGLTVVAEGVERETQREVLEQLGCEVMQGWLVAPGLPVAAFDRWLVSWPGQSGGRP